MGSPILDVIIKGSKFFYENGTQIFLRRVEYGSWSKDFLADAEGCCGILPRWYLWELTSISAPVTFQMAAEYMACGNPTSDHADFWGVGNTSWCNNSTFTSSDYSQITQGFSDYPLPLFIANYSCLSFTSDISNQKFEEVRTTYGPKMTSVWSGRIVSGWMGVDDGDDYSVAFNGTIPYYVLVFNNTIEIKQNYKALFDAPCIHQPFHNQVIILYTNVTRLAAMSEPEYNMGYCHSLTRIPLVKWMRKFKQRKVPIEDGLKGAQLGHGYGPHAELLTEGQKSELWAHDVATKLRASLSRAYELEHDPMRTGSNSLDIWEMR
ncbi:hypothetical protein DID88_004168 [Monilinia fructigena]|uniref:1,3-beta-glucanosyltransferase n=1 Tax=Monilinia fructigena TaxID=38457 RepID=A0A395ITA1_9HELO|nr:hypothetical protein DID88_004168 [Monilinia fructigena]